MTLLRHHVSATGGRAIVTLSGELDISAAGALQTELDRLEADPSLRSLVLDLRELEFMDSTGLRLVVTADLRAQEHGRRFTVVRGGRTVQRVFALTGLSDRLRFVDAPEDAA